MKFEHLYWQHCETLIKKQQFRQLPQHQPTEVVANFSSNDYLGLSQHPALKTAATQAIEQWGTGSTGSRLLSGNLPIHEKLETTIAQAKGTEAALIFNSGYQANATVLAALTDKRVLKRPAIVLADRLNHASLHHACCYAKVEQVRFKHNDMSHLEQLLKHYAQKNFALFILAETVYGMDGDIAPIAQLQDLATQYNAFLYLDEAHATGILGPHGYGLSAVEKNSETTSKLNTIAMGTFSKAIGCSGAYIACSQAIKKFLINQCSGFIYSTALPPAVSASILTAFELLPTLKNQRKQILEMTSRLKQHCRDLGLHTTGEGTVIVTILLKHESIALDLKNALLANGLLTSAIRPPTVPPYTARVRIAICAHHTETQFQALLTGIKQWVEQKNMPLPPGN